MTGEATGLLVPGTWHQAHDGFRPVVAAVLQCGRPQEVPLSMSYRCEVCNKEPWFGKQVSFSHKRSSRRWLPNIQKVRVKHGSNSKRMRVCTSCIKAGKIQKV
jgi:large subunit ribosomal protein L28